MRNAANKMTNLFDPYTENHFLSLIEIFERNGSLCGSHSSSLWLSLAQKGLARRATPQLRSSSLSKSRTDMWFSAFKILSLPVPSSPATRRFFTTRPDPVPKSKTTTRQSLLLISLPSVLWSPFDTSLGLNKKIISLFFVESRLMRPIWHLGW